MSDTRKTKSELIDELNALRMRNEELEAIYNSIGDGLIVLDLEAGTIMRANPALVSMLGYSEEELLGMPVTKVHPPEEFQRVGGEIEKGRRGLNRVPDLACMRKDGSTFPVDITGMTVNYQGRPCGVAVFKDITERKQAEEELRETRDYLENLLNYANAPIIVWDPSYRITRFNHAFERLVGQSADEVVGRSLEILFPEDSREESMAHIRRTMTGERWEVLEIPILRQDGTVRTVLWNSATLFGEDGETVVATIAQGQDISERKKAEEEMRDAEANFRALADNATDGILVASGEGTHVYVNKRAAEIMGYSGAELLKTSIKDLAHPDEHKKIMDVYRRRLEGQPVPRVYETIIVRKDGKGVPVEVAGAKTVWKGESADMVFVRDITERKQTEEELEKQRKRLQELVEDLDRSNKELEQFAYVASHDLQEPLRMVASFTELLRKRYKGKLDDKADKYIDFAVDGSIRMQQLINDLLAYSRVGTRGKPFEPTDCGIAFEQAKANLHLAIEESGATVTGDTLPVVMADEAQLGQLFQNLIGNAIKFHGDEPPRIHVSAEQEGDRWLFSVKDNGIGFEPEFAERIFIIFQRLHSRGSYAGTGIGLSICARIVERHGGRIWAETEPGRGSTFYFTIPERGGKK